MFEIGLMFWATPDPASTLAEVAELGIACGQLGIPGELPLAHADEWRKFRLYSVIAAFEGEQYTDVPTVEATVGFVPRKTRAAREERMLALSDFAAELGVPGIGTHIGFVPQDRDDPEYAALRDLVRRICDHAARHSQTFALETGQETAAALRQFLADVDRPNLGINFDPANMILYGTGDPIEALDILGPHILSVHAKDGHWPPAGVPGALGEEKALGEGAVGVERFLAKLQKTGYTGPLFIEREASDPARRLADVRNAVTLLRGLTSYSIQIGNPS